MIDINKTYKTRDGKEVRIYATDGGGRYPVHGALLFENETGWSITVWTSKGRWSGGSEHPHDLIEVKPRIKDTFWINAYKGWYGSFNDSRKEADENCNERRIACLQINLDFEEGEGL